MAAPAGMMSSPQAPLKRQLRPPRPLPWPAAFQYVEESAIIPTGPAMTPLQRLLYLAARKIAANPQAREKAAEIYRDEVKPRAEQAVQKARPKVEAAKAELRDMATETDPLREPARFAGRLVRRVIDKAKGK
jgi:hypothetical protein